MRDFIDLTGASGATYRFRLWPAGAPHMPIAGNYACVREDGDGYTVVLLGEALDLSAVRDKLPKKVREATTHIYTRLNVARAARCAEHEDLMAQQGGRSGGRSAAPAPASEPAAPAAPAA
jgi:hypothetical protein